MPIIQSVGWNAAGTALRILDQTELPEREEFLELTEIVDTVEAIRSLRVRGAPAIGVAAAIGLVVALRGRFPRSGAALREQLSDCAAELVAARPTAVNLGWAIRRMMAVADGVAENGEDDVLISALRAEAQAILDEDTALCERIGMHGLPLLKQGARVLTHCNAGALATAGIGTALAPVYLACREGRRVHVFADETRPLRQGARLTAWELSRAGIDVTVLPDGAAASLLRERVIDVVIVGADRIARNGDVANKIGTYPLALAARAHNIPFYVAAPYSTFDADAKNGAEIPIEQRSAHELLPLPPGVNVYNPAFDITPAHFVTGYITDRGLLTTPFDDGVFGA